MLNRLLITGAAGGLGKVSRTRLTHLAHTLRLSDVAPLGDAGPGEEVMPADLGDAAAVDALVAGCDGIVHLGGISVEDCFSRILNANIVGIFNLYEAARRHGVKRVFLASSNHTIGFYRQHQRLDETATFRPDGLYGVSKCYAETMALLYHDKFGIETARVRIGSCFSQPMDRRQLSTWLSYDDFVALVERVFQVERLGCPVIYGASANDAGWWDNSHLTGLGWQPKDNAEIFRAAVEAAAPAPAANDPAALYHGGKFAADPIFPEA